MSELQNKAVALAAQNDGDLARQSPVQRSALFLKSALDLYFALGGDAEGAIALAGDAPADGALRVDAAVANVMVELAVASHLSDIDMVQATYNRLDLELGTAHRGK